VACKKPLNNFQDFKGLKTRVPTITSYMRVWELLGTAPIAMSLNEVYSSLQTGVIEAQENDIAMTNNLGFYEVAPYAVMTEHVPYEASLYFNEKAFKSYPEELQQIILEVGRDIMLESREMISNIEKEALAKMEKDGVTIIRPDLTEFREATKSMRDEYSYAKPILDLIDKAKVE
jgi:TRAP-type C4-dicarboxylate transport system substrate-binding protein